jgi:hypothetical protein
MLVKIGQKNLDLNTNLENKESAVVEINPVILKFDSNVLELNSLSIQCVVGRVVPHGSSRHL